MTLQELRYVAAVAALKHFGRASEACHVSQPALSAGVKRLEEELGVVLFERGRRGVLVTPEGQALVAQARRVLGETDRLRELARHHLEPMSGVLRLGVIPTVGPYLLPHVVPGLRRAWPALRLHLTEDRTDRLLEALRDGDLDAALLSPPLDAEGLDRIDLYDEDLQVALPPDHPLLARKRLRPGDLAREPLLLLDEGHCLRDQALEVCRQASDGPVRELLRASSLETLRSMVGAGVGITLLPALAVRRTGGAPDLVHVRPFVPPAPRRTVSLYWRQDSPREISARLLAKDVRGRLPAGLRRPRATA